MSDKGRALLQQAFDALFPYRSTFTRGYTLVDQTLDALREVLATPPAEDPNRDQTL